MSLSMSEYVFSEESGIGNVSIEGSAGFNVRVVAGMYENSIIKRSHHNGEVHCMFLSWAGANMCWQWQWF